MNNEIKNNNNGKSNAPLIIIGVVLLAAIVGGWYLYNNSKQTPNKNTNTNSVKTAPTPDMIPANAPVGASPANIMGSPTAAVTIEEFADYQCPTCATQHVKMKEITGLYGNRIKFIFRSFPLQQIHKNAYEAAIAAEAAGMQGKFWAMQDQLFTNQQAWSNSSDARKIFDGYAEKLGLDLAKYQSDVAGMPAKTRVDADLARGRGANINGTPTIFLNGKKLILEQMEVAALKQLIDAELQKSGGQTAAPAPANSSEPKPPATNTAVNSANKTAGNANTSVNSANK